MKPESRLSTPQSSGAKVVLSVVATEAAAPESLAVRLEGNERVERARLQTAQTIDRLVRQLQGTTIRNAGASWRVVFGAPDDSLEFAVRAVVSCRRGPVAICAGIHSGVVDPRLSESLDDLTNMAELLAARAGPAEIWVTDTFKAEVELLAPSRERSRIWQMHPNCVLEGVPGRHLVWSLRPDDET